MLVCMLVLGCQDVSMLLKCTLLVCCYEVQCCQVHGFHAELDYFYTVAMGCFFSPRIEAEFPASEQDFFQSDWAIFGCDWSSFEYQLGWILLHTPGNPDAVSSVF